MSWLSSLHRWKSMEQQLLINWIQEKASFEDDITANTVLLSLVVIQRTYPPFVLICPPYSFLIIHLERIELIQVRPKEPTLYKITKTGKNKPCYSYIQWHLYFSDNAIPIKSWFNDPSDTALLNLLPVLDALRFVTDVRSVLSRNREAHRNW